MKHTVCDRCGKDMTEDRPMSLGERLNEAFKNLADSFNGSPEVIVHLHYGDVGFEEVDLCKDCRRALLNGLEAGKHEQDNQNP